MKKTCLNRLSLLYLSIVKKKSVKMLSSYEVGPQGGSQTVTNAVCYRSAFGYRSVSFHGTRVDMVRAPLCKGSCQRS